MGRYFAVQLLSVSAVFAAVTWWSYFPGESLNAATRVETLMMLLQSAIVPNAFMSLLTAVLLIPAKQLRKLAGCFFSSIIMLWGIVCSTLAALWYILAHTQLKPALLPTFTADHFWLVSLVPVAMVLAVIFGVIIAFTPRLRFLVPHVRSLQAKTAVLFECVYVLVPLLVFFVVLRFLNYTDFDITGFMLDYFLLAVSLVSIVNIVIFPLLYRYFIGVRFFEYAKLIYPIVLMTFLAGDSVAAVPLVASAADEFGEKDHSISHIISVVVICFPWVGELCNLVFPIYSAILEQYDFSSILSILSVGPFFMFTDPYVSIPNLLSVYNFSEVYQVSYMTAALLTDHMFEMCEVIAVLFVVLRLKLTLFRNTTTLDD